MAKKMTEKTTLDSWSDICQNFVERGNGIEELVHPIHTCVIDGQRHYVHAPNLDVKHPTYFKRLCRFAQKHGIKLKADRRGSNTTETRCRRKKLLPIIFLALGTSANVAIAENKTSLKLFSTPAADVASREERSPEVQLDSTSLDFRSEHSRKIKNILKAHFSPGEDDPENIEGEFELLSQYYAKHPEAMSLIDSISNASWQLKYAPHTFQTDVSGSRLNVEKVTVYFDPRSGAKLKFYDKCSEKKPFCVASPADALLHELLHVQTIVNDTATFIAQGGLGQHVYPVEHERLTILKENILYKRMTKRDHVHRPIRSEHSGRHVLVSCVTCYE